MTNRDNDTIPMIIMAITLFLLFVGISTDNGLYFGYFWKLCLFISNL